MPLAYLLDEHLRGPLWRAICRHNASTDKPVDVVRVGDDDAPKLGTADTDLLIWSETANRILVTCDERTMPLHLAEHLDADLHHPGIFVIRPRQNIAAILEFLIFAAVASEESEWQDQIVYIP